MLKHDKSYFRLRELQDRWEAPGDDMEYYIMSGLLQIRVWVFDIEAINVAGPEPVILNGMHAVYPDELWEVLRTGSGPIKRFSVNDVELHRTELTPSFIVRESDLMVTREERDRFERQCGFTTPEQADERSKPFNPLDTFWHDPTYANVSIGSDKFSLGPIQAAVVRQLHEAASSNDPWIHQDVLLDKAGSASARLVDIFSSKEKLNALFERDGGGAYRLNLPKRSTTALCRSAYGMRSSPYFAARVGRPSHPSHPPSHPTGV